MLYPFELRALACTFYSIRSGSSSSQTRIRADQRLGAIGSLRGIRPEWPTTVSSAAALDAFRKNGRMAVSMRLQRAVRGEPSGVSDSRPTSVRTISSLGPVGIGSQRTIGVPKCLNLPRYAIEFHLILFQETLKRWGSGYLRAGMWSSNQFSRGGRRVVHVRGYERGNVQTANTC